MKIYHYHPETRDYLGFDSADESPLELDVYLIPAYATDIEPPMAHEKQKVVFNLGTNEWRIEEIQTETPPQTER